MPLIGTNTKTPALYVLAGTGNVAMANLAAAQTATGVTFSCLEVFATNVASWTDWESPWFSNDPSQGYISWLAADTANRQLIVSISMIPTSAGSMTDPLTWETAGAGGAYNTHAANLARNLVAAGMGSSVIRLGLEMNGNWNIDAVGGSAPGGGTAAMRTAWAQTWAQQVAAMKAVPGANFLFCWCPNAVVAGVTFLDYYPGDAAVDIIGIDAYDAFANGTQPAPSAATTTSLFGQAFGLTDITTFARSRGKPLALGEWGCVLGGTSGGLGDDPFYVQGIASWVAANNVAFHSYFDSNNDGIIPLSSAFPQTLAAYTAAFASTPGAPTVVTTAASGVSASAAILNGTVNPRTASATWQFDYGPVHSLIAANATTNQGTGHTEPDVHLFGGTYYCYYRDDTTGHGRIHLMTGSDGVAWTESVSNPMLDVTAAAWDSSYVISPSVILVGGTYYMFYEGNNGSFSAIGYATASAPGGPWTKYVSNPVLSKTGAGFESVLVGTPAIWNDGTTWYLFYHGYNGTHDQVALAWASSPSGTWTRHPSNPVIPVGKWFAGKVAPSSVWADAGNLVHVALEGDPGTGKWSIGVAQVPAASLQTAVPVLTGGSQNSPMLTASVSGQDNDYVQLPCLVSSAGGTLWLYYSGHSTGGAFRLFRTTVNVDSGYYGTKAPQQTRHVGAAIGYGTAGDMTPASYLAVVGGSRLQVLHFFYGASIPASLAAAPGSLASYAGTYRAMVDFELTHYGVNGTYPTGTPAAQAVTDRNNMEAFISSCQAGGLDLTICLWHEPYNKFNTQSTVALNNQDYCNSIGYYGEILRKHGIPVIFNPSNFSAQNHNTAGTDNPLTIGTSANPGLGWSACNLGYIDDIRSDFYVNQQAIGTQGVITACTDLAALFGLPFGFNELGYAPATGASFSAADVDAFTSYVASALAYWVSTGGQLSDIITWATNDNAATPGMYLASSWSATTLSRYQAMFDLYDGGSYPDFGTAGSGSVAVPESYSLAGLTASRAYHYRLNATNSFGTTRGADQSFTATSSGGGGVPMTVTASVSNFNDGGAFKVFVLTGVTEAGGASAQLQAFGPAADTVSVTPAASGSLILFGVFERNTVALSAAASNSVTDTGAIGTAYTYAEGRYTGTVTGGSPVTAGISTAPNDWNDIVAYELKASGTPLIDGSTPAAAVSLSSTLATASFTPPGGSVLAAVVMSSCQGTAASVITITDTSGLGLTWTKRAQVTQTGSYAGVAAIYTATVPGAGSPSGAPSTGITITPSATGSKGSGQIGRGQLSSLAQVAGGTGTSLAVPWPVNPSAGSSILLFVESGNPALAATSVVDNGTTPRTFTLDASNTNADGGGNFIYRADNITLPASGAYTVTVTISSTRNLQAAGIEYIGKKAGGPDATAVSQNATSSSVTTGSVTPAAAGGVAFGGFTSLTAQNPESITFTGSSPQASQFTASNGAFWTGLGVADALTGSAQNFSWTLGDAPSWAGVAVAYSPPTTVFSGSPSTGITTGNSVTGTPRIAVTRSTGITITPSAAGTRGGAGSPSTGITITPSATGLAGTPAGPPVFPARNLGIKAELLLNGTWTDITAYVYQRDPVQISGMGRADWTSAIGAAQLTMTLNNRDGRFSPKNSAGTYFPFIARNVQVRVSVSSQSVTGAVYSGYRFWGEVAEWPPRWDPSGHDVTSELVAAGIWRRISQLQTTLGSAFTRYNSLTLTGASVPRSYWPMEDGSGSTQLVPFGSVAGTPKAVFTVLGTNAPSLAASTDFRGSDAIVMLNGAAITATVPAGGTATNNVTRMCVSVPATGDSASGTTNWNLLEIDSAGTVAKLEVYLNFTGTLLMQGRNSGGTVVFSGTTTTNIKGLPVLLSCELTPSGGNVAWAMRIIAQGATGITESVTGTLSAASTGAVSAVIVSRASILNDTAAGHLSVSYGAPSSMVSAASALGGYTGEKAMDRFTRLCGEMGIATETIGAASATAAMGPQLDDHLADVLQTIEDTDCGLLYESRGQFGLGYRSNASMANQAAAATLSYTAAVLDASLAPTYDDQLVRNNITVTNQSTGYTQQAVLASGAMSVLSPPSGIGNGYAFTRSVSAASDSQVAGIATFLLNVGTVDEVRFPVLTLKMVRASNASLFAVVPGLRIGDYLQVTNPPSFLTSAAVKQLAWGYSETLNAREWTFALNTVPETPWETGFSPGTVQIAQIPGSGAVTSSAPGAGGLGGILTSGSITPAMLNEGITIHTLGGNAVTISATAPATPNLNDMWIASATGLMSQWNGTSWVPILFNGTATIQAGTITSALIRSGTIVAGNIAAGTITAALLAAGIVVAGIVDATTVNAAQYIATGTQGEFLAYTGTPATGNLAVSISGFAGSDGLGNPYAQGIEIQSGGLILDNQGAAPPAVAGATVLYGSVAGRLRMIKSSGADDILERGSVNTATFSVGNTTTAGAVSGTMNYKAADAAQSSTYEIEIAGTVTMGATPETLTLKLYVDGVNIGGAGGGFVIGAAPLNAAAAWSHRITFTLAIATAGSSGTARVSSFGCLSDNSGTNLQGTTMLSPAGGGGSAGAGFDTTVNHSIWIAAFWGGTGGAAQKFETSYTRITRYS